MSKRRPRRVYGVEKHHRATFEDEGGAYSACNHRNDHQTLTSAAQCARKEKGYVVALEYRPMKQPWGETDIVAFVEPLTTLEKNRLAKIERKR